MRESYVPTDTESLMKNETTGRANSTQRFFQTYLVATRLIDTSNLCKTTKASGAASDTRASALSRSKQSNLRRFSAKMSTT